MKKYIKRLLGAIVRIPIVIVAAVLIVIIDFVAALCGISLKSKLNQNEG